MKTGLEIEFWVIDDRGELDRAKPVSERVYFASQEFSKSMIEIQTEPHEDLSELLKEAISKTEILAELAKKDGKKIVPLGTPINSGEVDIYESERSRIEKEVIGPQVLHAGRTAGLHIHFEKENVLEQLNTLIALDPCLAAISSSPYYQGKPIADGSRNKVYRYRACGPFPEQRQLWSYKNSLEEWRYKRRQLFDKFGEKSREAGVEPEELRKHFQPEDAVWTPVRLREDYPTVEWRAPDTSLLSEVVKLVKEVVPKVRENSFKNQLPEFKKVKSASGKAINNGLKSKDVSSYLEDIDVNYSHFKPLSSRIKQQDQVSQEKARDIRLKMAEKTTEDLKEAKKTV